MTPDLMLLASASKVGPNDLRSTASVEIIAAAAKEGEPAKLPTFKLTAYTGVPMQANWGAPVVVDLAGLKVNRQEIPVFLDHDASRIVGQSTSVKIGAEGVAVEGTITGDDADAKKVIANAKNGFKWQVSIGASVTRREFLEVGKKQTVNGREVTGPLMIAREATLREVSFVAMGADDNTTASVAASRKEVDMEFTTWLAAKGFDLATLSDPQKASLKAMFDAEQTPSPAPPANDGDLKSILAAAAAKQARVSAITTITAREIQNYPDQLAVIEAMSKQAIAGDWDASRYELELLRATRPNVPAVGRATTQDEGLTGEVIEAAVCMAGGIKDVDEHFDEKVLNAASKRWRHGLGLGELLHLFARRNGHTGTSTRDVGPLLRAAFAPVDSRDLRASGVSMISIGGILSNVANKALAKGFNAVESTWREIAAIRNVKDFKQVSSYSLNGDWDYKLVAPGGELKHATAGETTYTNQATTYGRLFAIDRRDIINDDLGALTSVPQKLGRGGALKLNLVFWTAFLDDATFFNTDKSKKNYIDGATAGATTDSRMNIDGLGLAETTFLNQTDPDGKPLGITPKLLLVPNALNATASALMRSTEIRDTTASTKFATSNPHAGKFTVVRSSYLSNSSITGYSAAAWYLLADPQDLAVIEVAFLNGVETPTVETADADFSTLGIQMRGFHDFGVAKQEYRAGVKSKGAAA